MTYRRDHSAGSDALSEAHQALALGVLPLPQKVLVADEVGLVVHHEGAALHPDGVAVAQVGAELRAVAAAFIRAALEVTFLVENDLMKQKNTFTFIQTVFCCVSEPVVEMQVALGNKVLRYKLIET